VPKSVGHLVIVTMLRAYAKAQVILAQILYHSSNSERRELHVPPQNWTQLLLARTVTVVSVAQLLHGRHGSCRFVTRLTDSTGTRGIPITNQLLLHLYCMIVRLDVPKKDGRQGKVTAVAGMAYLGSRQQQTSSGPKAISIVVGSAGTCHGGHCFQCL
jgi:hypothetical protein